MNEVMMLHGSRPKEILQAAIDKNIPLALSYLSKGKWQVLRVLLAGLEADSFNIRILPKRKQNCLNFKVGQSVGISLKYGYGSGYDKFVFDTTVTGSLSLPSEPDDKLITLAMPEEIEVVQRRSYIRANVPKSHDVDVTLWSRSCDENHPQIQPEHYWRGKLVDISAGGAQVAVNVSKKHDFSKGQFVGLRFVPTTGETPLVFNAQIKSVFSAADGQSICLGFQMVGLEASPEGRMVLQRLCNVVEQYHQLNKSDTEK